MSPEFLLLVQLAIGLTFLGSCTAKLRHPSRFLRGMTEYDFLAERLSYPVGIVVILLEAAIAFSHLTGWMLTAMAPVALCLLSAFMLTVLATLGRGLTVSCLCFGAADGEVVSKRTAVRLGLLIFAEALLWFRELSVADPAMPYELSAREMVFALLCSGLALLAVSWSLSIPEIVALQRKCRNCRKVSA